MSSLRAPTVMIQEKGIRRIDENDMANLGTMREGKMVSVDRAQFGEVQSIILDMLAEVWRVDAAAVVQTIEHHIRRQEQGVQA